MYYSKKDINSAYLSALNNQGSALFSELLSYFFDCMGSYMYKCATSVTPSAAVQDDIISMYKIRMLRYMKNYSTDRGTPFKYCCSIINSVNKRFIEDFHRRDKRVVREETYYHNFEELSEQPKDVFSSDIIKLCEEHLTSCKMDSIMRSKHPENVYIEPEAKEALIESIKDLYSSL